MSREYAENRIKEALKAHNGNPARAKQQILAWTYEDPKLLHALTKAHLSGIVAYNIERVMSGRGVTKPEQVKQAPAQKPANEKEQFGKEILKAVVGRNTAVFGQESYAPQVRRGKASQNHVNAIHEIVRRSKEKK